jgi:uncharacterized protein (DUF2237 family)
MKPVPDQPYNVLGGELLSCSDEPLTGFFRDSYCNTCDADIGRHTICAVMTAEFLAFEKYVGNDLSTPRPEWNFPGLRPGDQWCVVAARFLQAHDEGCAPKVRLEATHIRALEIVKLEILQQYAA